MGREKDKKDLLCAVNKLAYLEGDFTTAQIRILMALLRAVQDPVSYHVLGNKAIPRTGHTFPTGEKNGHRLVKIPVKVADFHMPENNSRLKSLLRQMPDIIYCIDYPPYSRTVTIYLHHRFYSLLLDSTDGYFYISHADVLELSNRYTVRIYWLICSWQNRGGFVIREDLFRRILGITGKYLRSDNLDHVILIPAQKSLRELCTVWFEYRRLTGPQGPLVVFKIKRAMTPAQREDLQNSTAHYLEGALAPYHIPYTSIYQLISAVDAEDLPLLKDKVAELRLLVGDNPSITDKGKYILTSLQHWLSSWLHMYGTPAPNPDSSDPASSSDPSKSR